MVLRCLKDSDAIHNRVMLHVASFVHGTSLNILLPLAEYRDLEIFLNEGYDFSQKIYDIKETFPSYSTPEFPAQMMTEFSRVTAGLGWLHANLTLGEDGDGYCTHMDLKTDNILVGHDPNCPVGKWMLSDFGLSRFKKITGEWNREARIIQRFSNRTQARRAPATYQAPEVQLREDRTVGRKNDIWSMTCIFSEVFVFALKGKKSLDDFRHARLSHGNDYFYSVKASDGLPASPSQEYEVKNSIVDALDKLAEGRTLDAFQRAWIKCGTNVIREGLTIDQGKRLDATELYAHLRHVRDHCSASSKAEKITCPFDPDRLPDPEPPGTFKLPGWRRSSNDSIPGSLCSSSASANSMGIGGNLPRSHSVGSGIALPQLASSNTARTPVRSFSLGSTVLPRQLVSSNEVDMASLARTPARHPKAISLCPQGQRVAYLFENCIYVYSLNASSKNIASPPIRVDLEPDKTWKYLQLAGSYLVAWGSSHSPSRRPVSDPAVRV
jgi:serine/threonine protein kinase